MMSRTKLNFIVDAVAFVAFLFLTTTGVLIHYILPPRTGRFAAIWGLTRHDWGEVHFWLAVVMLAAMGVHLFLHWRWIKAIVSGRPREGSGARLVLGAVGLAALLALAVAPFFGPIEKLERQGRGRNRAQVTREEPGRTQGTEAVRTQETRPVRIRGSMTFRQAARRNGVPSEHILSALGLTDQVSEDERIGHAGRSHGFTIEDVRRIILEYDGGD